MTTSPSVASPVQRMPDGLRLAAAYLLHGAGLAVVVTLLMGWDGLAHPWLLSADTVIAMLAGVAVLVVDRRGREVPLAAQYGIAVLGIALISGTSAAIGGTEGAVFACAYAGAVAITAMHYPLRNVLALFGLTAAAYGIVVAVVDAPLTQWVLVVGVAGSSGLLTGRFHSHLRQMTARLQHLESWRSMLMSSLAHDLRSPLGMADTTLHLLETRAEDLTGDQRRDLLAAARRHQQHALQLSHDLLDHERVHAGALELELRPTVLVDVVTAACAHVPVDVQVEIDDGLVVDADPGRLQQIIANLVSNAGKYGRPPVEVGAERVDDEVQCWVRDHGPGLPNEQASAVFGRFAASDAADSVGLGLWIVDRLIRAHGGELTYEHAEPGARFTWTLQPASHPLARS